MHLFLFPHQKLVLMFGLEHGSHLLQIEPVSLLLKLRGEEDGDDPLGDVGQVKVIVTLHHSLHHTIHTEAPGETVKKKWREKGEKKKRRRGNKGRGVMQRDTERKVDTGQNVTINSDCL